MPSPEKLKRIYELCAEHDLDYFGKEWDRQTIEYMLCAEFPDEEDEYDNSMVESDPPEQSKDMRWWKQDEEQAEEIQEESTLGYWLFGIAVPGLLIYIFWEVFVMILIILGVIVFLGFKFLAILFAGGGGSSSSGSSYSVPDNETYGLQRASGATWYTIAQGPENWMIDKLYQNRAKDGARYRVVKLVNGKPAGTTYS